MGKDEIEQIADLIIERLFTNGFGEQADRIAMRQREGDTERDLGGWNRAAAREQIIAAIVGK